MFATLARASRLAAPAAVVLTLLWGGLATAQLGDPGGPGQAVTAPPAQCPHTIACVYSERNPFNPSDGYRFQSLQVCGANCSTQYWVTNAADGRVLLSIDPVRGGGVVATGRGGGPDDARPPIRVIVPDYAPTDAMCCPSGYKETTYTWNAAQNMLVAGTSTVIPAASFPGWDGVRSALERDGFFEVFRGL